MAKRKTLSLKKPALKTTSEFAKDNKPSKSGLVAGGGVKMPTLNYKGFDICPASQQCAGSGWWTLRVLIENRTGDNKFAAFFDAPNTFPGKVEAEKQSVFFGKKIIDGEVPGYSVEGLT